MRTQLNGQELEAMKLFTGLDDSGSMVGSGFGNRISKVASELGMSKTRACQIRDTALWKLLRFYLIYSKEIYESRGLNADPYQYYENRNKAS